MRFKTNKLAYFCYGCFLLLCFNIWFVNPSYVIIDTDWQIVYPKQSPVEVMVDVTNNLGLMVLECHNYNSFNNMAFSPYGVAAVLVALYEGVAGAARIEIRNAARLPKRLDIVRVGFRDIHRLLRSYFIPQEGFLAGLSLNNNITLTDEYLAILRFYGYDVESQFTTQRPVTTEIATEPSLYNTTTPMSTTDMTLTTATSLNTGETTFPSTIDDYTTTMKPTTDIFLPTIPQTTSTLSSIPTEESTFYTTTEKQFVSTSTSKDEETTMVFLGVTEESIETSPKPTISTTYPSEPTSTNTMTTTFSDTTETMTEKTTPTYSSTMSNIPTTQVSTTAESTLEDEAEMVTGTTSSDRVSRLSTITQQKTSPYTANIPDKGTTEESNDIFNDNSFTTSPSVSDEESTIPIYDRFGGTSSTEKNSEEPTSSVGITDTTERNSEESSEPVSITETTKINTEMSSEESAATYITSTESSSLETESVDTTVTTKFDSTANTERSTTGEQSEFVTVIDSTAYTIPVFVITDATEQTTSNEQQTGDNFSQVGTEPTTDKESNTTPDSENGISYVTVSSETTTESTTVSNNESDRTEESTYNTKETTSSENESEMFTEEQISTDLSTSESTYKPESINATTNDPSVIVFPDRNRTRRSVVDYLLARHHDTNGDFFNFYHPMATPPPPPPPPPRPAPRRLNRPFLANGFQPIFDVNYTEYEAVLPYLYMPRIGAQALKFPLDSDKYYLLVILPSNPRGMNGLIYDLTRHLNLKYIIGNLKDTYVRAVIPSFKLSGFVVLTNALQRLGLRSVFEPGHSDFSIMTKDDDTYVTNIEQAVTVNIRNYMEPKLLSKREYLSYKTADFIAAHPFLYFIMDAELNVALMAGKILNPLNSRIQ